MAQLSAPPIPLKMYRRFAVATVLVTACIAMFADGEEREARVGHLEVETSAVEEEDNSGATLVRRESTQQRSGFNDTGQYDVGDFGSPMIVPPSGGTSGRVPTKTRQSAIPGYTQEYLDSLSEEEYQRLLESLSDEGILDPRERQRNINALEAASRRRSGNAATTG